MKPLDTHAHVQPDIAPFELSDLGAFVVAVTRTAEEYQQAFGRSDATTAWALGCHPGLAAPHRDFDVQLFAQQVETSPIVGEIGLDAESRVPLATQCKTLRQILSVLQDSPRVSTVHSAGATAKLLDLLAERPVNGVILHWWRGSRSETERAVDIGCYFSVNSRELSDPRVIDIVPRERVLTETDHPFGDTRETKPRRPGHMGRTIQALATAWQTDGESAVRQVWRNWHDLCSTTETLNHLPEAFFVETMSA